MKSTTKNIVLSSIMVALVFIATYIIKIPFSSQGYFNIGDCVVLLCGWILSPSYAFFSAGIGSLLADILSGYVIYAVPTLIIKGFMAVSANYVFRFLKLNNTLSYIISGIVAELIMISGYFIFEIFMYGLFPALLNIGGSAFQGIVGLLLGVILINIFNRNRLIR